MAHNNTLHFDSIKIEGYRGRNFELNMNPRDENSVFVLDGNTGKTTTIELLRWCFVYSESGAKGKFKHMWTKQGAHVLDFLKENENQTCLITINFNVKGNNYSFKRITVGTYLKDVINKVEGDRIEKIQDVLEINNGAEVIRGDDVNRYLNKNFDFGQCAEHFCFDGEKAREVMQSSANDRNIDILLEIVNERTTNKKLTTYENKLRTLKDQVYSLSRSKLTDKTLQNIIDKIIKKEKQLRIVDIDVIRLGDDIRLLEKTILQETDELNKINEEISESKSEMLIEKTKLENYLKLVVKDIENKRTQLYTNSLDWINIDVVDPINIIKNKVKENGKLPEPFREDLIKSCIESDPPTCQICGRELDETSKQRIKELEKTIAKPPVHAFLSNNFVMDLKNFNPSEVNNDIKELIEKEYNKTILELNSIQLSNKDEKLIKDRDVLYGVLYELSEQKGGKETDQKAGKECITILKKEIKELTNKNAALEENRIILDKIDDTLDLILGTQEKTKERAVGIISDVISEGVGSILGPNFSARLTKEEGLLLGQDGFYNPEIGGMSGRLILSYCFAEAMTLIDPLIVDTPSGNIGSHRKALAEHLNANHKQVILLCLPTEIEEFAPYLSQEEPIKVINESR